MGVQQVFLGARGLRQEDPLSLYLFVLGMEALSLMIDKVAEGGYISEYKFKGKNGTVSYYSPFVRG